MSFALAAVGAAAINLQTLLQCSREWEGREGESERLANLSGAKQLKLMSSLYGGIDVNLAKACQ